MWWSRRSLLLALAAPLAGCGFTPALAPGAPAAGLQGRIRADDPPDRDAAEFLTRLEERLGRPTAPGWTLAYRLEVTETRLGLEAGIGETRGQMVGNVVWALTPEGAPDTRPGDPVARGQSRQFAGFSRTATPLANRAAAEDARRRLARMLADAVVAELTATASRWAGSMNGLGP